MKKKYIVFSLLANRSSVAHSEETSIGTERAATRYAQPADIFSAHFQAK